MAGLQIIIPGADFSGSGIPKNTRLLPGTLLPAYDALGAWLFDEGTEDQVYSGEFANIVAGGQRATVKAGWTAPTIRNYGSNKGGFSIEAVNGTFIDSNVSAARSAFTAAMVFRMRPKQASLALYNVINMLSSDSANSLPASNAGNLSVLGKPLWGVGFSQNDSITPQLLKTGHAVVDVSGTTHTNLGLAPGGVNEWIAIGVSINGPEGVARVQTLTSSSVVTDAARGDTAIQDAYVTNLASRDGTYLFGAMPNGAARDSSGPIADVMCACVYGNYKAGDEMTQILRGLAKVAADRGVTVLGY